MIFCEKILMKIKISLRQNVEKSISRKRYFYLFVCLGVFISVIKLPRIPIYLLNPISLRLSFSTMKISLTTSSSDAFVFGSFFVFIFLIPFFLLFFLYISNMQEFGNKENSVWYAPPGMATIKNTCVLFSVFFVIFIW